jgi:serine/threonine protein kinase
MEKVHEYGNVDELKGIEWIQEVKRGSISTVWLVKKKEHEKEYVMKVTDKLKLVDRSDVSTIMSEKNIMEAINSPFLVNFVTSFQDKEKLYILMEYMPNGNLRQLLNKATLSEPQISNLFDFIVGFIILCLLFGLTHLHHQKILHLDLKPENIVIDEDKYARICDFGLSKFLSNKPKKKLLGTFGYQAPELFAASDSGNK